MHWYFDVLKKYAVFQGRASRSEFWFFALFNFIAVILLAMLSGLTGTFNPEYGIGLFDGLYTLAVFVPNLAVSVRRLHDTGRAGWWLLLLLIPLLGALALLVMFVLNSNPDDNEYGPNPKLTQEKLTQE